VDEYREVALEKRVDDARRERRLRSDDRQVDALALGEARQRRNVQGVDGRRFG
jgi:hypothetical protein